MSRPIPGPLHRCAPPRASTNGDLAAGVGADLGYDLDPEQRWSLDAIFAETAAGTPASAEFAIIGPRQTVGKTATLQVAAVADVDLFGAPTHIWTAHEFKTARKSYEDMRARLQASPDYRDRVSFRDAHGEEAIFFADGGTIEFHARSMRSGRGFTTSKITLDEALFLRPGDLGALAPTGVTMPDFQVRYGSSAGTPAAEALRQIRDRGRAPAPGETLAYAEYGAPRRRCGDPSCEHRLGTEGCALEDRDLWWQANSGLWFGRVTFEAMQVQRRMLSGVPEEFVREFYSWWEDPAGSVVAIDPATWAALRDPASTHGEKLVFAVDVAPDRSTADLVVAGVREDGRVHVEVVQRWAGTWRDDEVVARVRDVAVAWRPPLVGVDARGQAAGLVPDLEVELEPLGVAVHRVGAAEMAAACGLTLGRINGDGLRHLGSPALASAIAGARRREQGQDGAFTWDRRSSGVNISPLVGMSIAVYLLASEAAGPSVYEGRGLVTL